jgi:hypothetical protein
MTGAVAVASIFSNSAVTNLTTRQRTTATVLLYDKMEQLKAASPSNSQWLPGGDLDPDARVPGYFEFVTIDGAGVVSTSTTDSSLPYMRVWQIASGFPRSVTVAVHIQKAAPAGRRAELIRATAVRGNSF